MKIKCAFVKEWKLLVSMRGMGRAATFLLLSFLIFVFAGCGPAKYLSFATSPRWNEVKVIKVAVIPFVLAPEMDQKGLRSARVDPQGVSRIATMFSHGMEGLGYVTISFDSIEKESMTPKGTLPLDIVKSIGDKTGSEAVLTGIVTRYEDREGGPWAARKPASIGFDVKLISTSDGTILWNGGYAETQKSLLEDMGMFFTFIKRRGKWLTAEELARDGVNEVLKSLPAVKK